MVKRKVSLDILRIYATIQIVSFHCFAFPLKNKCFQLPLVGEILYTLTTTCNVHFMLISSYLASTSKYTFVKQFPLIFETFSYSLFFYFTSINFFHFNKFIYDNFLFYLFPIANSVYWYTGPFLLSGLICSLIYLGLYKQTKKFHISFMIIIFFLYCMQCVGYYKNLGLTIYTYSSFLVVSMIGSYLRFYEPKISTFFLIVLFILLGIFKYYTVSHETDSPHWYIRIFLLRDILQPTTILFGISSFLIAIKITFESKYEKYIQIISELSYPIFLIHMHIENRPLWYKPLKKLSYGELHFYWKVNLIMSLKIFIVCMLMEIIRKKYFDLFVYKRRYFKIFIEWLNKIIS